MKKRLQHIVLGLGLLVALAQGVAAQGTLGYKEVERRSKYLFLDDQFAALVAFGDTALDAGQDYFALRYRLGAANFKLEKYAAAARHFAKAHEMNSGETETMEYLYFSLFYAGRLQEAQLLIKDFPPSLQTKLGLKPHNALAGINLELGAKVTSDSHLIGNMGYLTLNLTHQLTPRFQIGHGLSVLTQDIRHGDYQQVQYYVAPRYYLGKGFGLNAAWHFVHYQGTRTFVGPDSVLPPPSGWPSGGLAGTGHLLHFGASYQKAYFQVKAYANEMFFSTREAFGPPRLGVDSLHQLVPLQVGMSLDLNPPIWKQRLFLSSTAAFHTLEGKDALIWGQSLGVRLTQKLYLEGRFMHCGTTYFNEFDGTLANNTSDVLEQRITGLLQWTINPTVGLYALYQHENKVSTALGGTYSLNNIITGINIKL